MESSTQRTTIDLSTGRTVLQTYDAGPGTPVALLLPAMGVTTSYYTPFVQALRAHGVSVATADYPGHGESTPAVTRRVDYGYRTLAEDWLPAVLDRVGEVLPGRPVALLAHSLGGHVAIAHLARHAHPSVRALVTLGSASPFWRTYDRPGMTLVKTQAVRLVSRVVGMWPGDRFGFGGRQPRTLMTEWSHFSRHGRLEPRGSGEYERAMAAIAIPALVIDLDSDDLAPARAVDHFADKLPGADVTRMHFTKGAGDPGRPVDHFSFARSPEVIDEVVARWIRDQVGQTS